MYSINMYVTKGHIEKSQMLLAAVGALLAVQGSSKLAGKSSKSRCSEANPSKPLKKSSLMPTSDNPKSSSSSSSSAISISLFSVFVLWGATSSSEEVAGEEEDKVGFPDGDDEVLVESLAVTVCGVTGFWRVLPASEFRWVGAG